jgi:ACDE family multidrug resistance protein
VENRLQSDKKWALTAIATIPLNMTLANSMLIPVLPTLKKELSISSFQTSLIITIYAAIAIVCIPFAGYLSDRYGRLKVIIPSLIIAAVGGVISGLAAWLMKDHAFWVISIGRFVQGIGAAGAFPIVFPLVGDMFQKEKDVSTGLGIVETFNTLGKVLSPIVGAALAAIVWFMPLMVIPLLCVISLVAVKWLVKPPNSADEGGQSLKQFIRSVKKIFHNDGTWLIAIFAIGVISMFVLFGFLFYLSTNLEEKHFIDGIWKGLIMAIPLAAICLVSFLTGKWLGAKKKLMKWVSLSGIVILTVAMLSCVWWPPHVLLHLLTIMFLSGIGIGMILPSLDALITEGIDKPQRGTITSIYSSMRFLGVAAGPLYAALLVVHETMLFWSFAVVSAFAGALALFMIKP